MNKIAFIGVGIMGKSMVRNLMKAGFELHIFARTRNKVEDIIGEGAIFHGTIGECVEACDAVITMVGFPADVEEVYFAPDNILSRAKQGAYLLDMTTSSPALAQRIYTEGKAKGYHVVDAPVTGGEAGAKTGCCLFWWAVTKQIMRPVCRCFKQWAPILIIRVKPGVASMQSLPIRL